MDEWIEIDSWVEELANRELPEMFFISQMCFFSLLTYLQESIAWLEQFLDRFRGTVVCITHDRYFLNNIAGWILELDRGKGYPHEGNYETFLETKTKRLADEQKQESAASRAVTNELEWIRTNPKAKGNKSKARLSRYDELLVAAAPKEMRNAGQIYIPPGPRLGNQVVEVNNLRKSFGDRLLIDDLSFSLPPAGIVGVVGPNGSGKVRLIISSACVVSLIDHHID
jgi:energy-dependent translational throttle protein EttA